MNASSSSKMDACMKRWATLHTHRGSLHLSATSASAGYQLWFGLFISVTWQQLNWSTGPSCHTHIQESFRSQTCTKSGIQLLSNVLFLLVYHTLVYTRFLRGSRARMKADRSWEERMEGAKHLPQQRRGFCCPHNKCISPTECFPRTGLSDRTSIYTQCLQKRGVKKHLCLSGLSSLSPNGCVGISWLCGQRNAFTLI